MLFLLAYKLLDAALVSLEGCGRPRPRHRGVAPSGGDWAPDKCCEGHAWARVLPGAPVATAQPASCDSQHWTFPIEVGVARCPAKPPKGVMGQVVFPSTRDGEEAARGQLGDAQALAAAAATVVQAWSYEEDDVEDDDGVYVGTIAAVQLGTIGWLNTATCLGVTAQVRVEVAGMCCAPVGPVVPAVAAPT